MFDKNDVKAEFEGLARSGAQKLCGYSNCIYRCFDCGHPKAKLGGTPPLLNPDALCPVAKYQVDDRGERDWTQCHVSEIELSQDELFALCACCDNTEVAEDGKFLTAYRKELRACMDCPVKAVEDCMQECSAEARF